MYYVQEASGMNGVILAPIIFKSVNGATGLCHFKQSGRIWEKYSLRATRELRFVEKNPN